MPPTVAHHCHNKGGCLPPLQNPAEALHLCHKIQAEKVQSLLQTSKEMESLLHQNPAEAQSLCRKTGAGCQSSAGKYKQRRVKAFSKPTEEIRIDLGEIAPNL
ncbi:hypothetical protein ACOSQ2_026761 [Xanthoceras sorbifolium]